MFTKRPDKEPAPLEPTKVMGMPTPQAAPVHAPARPSPLARADKSMPAVIGADLTIMGNLISKGEVQVDGEVQGDLHCSHVVVGERARITGGIIADDVVVRGQVMGSIRGLRVTLQSSSHVEGDIYHQSLAIEQGAYFEGKSRRAEDPTAGMKPGQPASAAPGDAPTT
ncbi:MAG: polymer-forming cytoskeletal protein [Hyphomicrobiaceae bacterium]